MRKEHEGRPLEVAPDAPAVGPELRDDLAIPVVCVRHVVLLVRSGWRANHRGRFSTSGTRERVRSKSARKDGGVANQRNILLTSSFEPRTSSGTWTYVIAA